MTSSITTAENAGAADRRAADGAGPRASGSSARPRNREEQRRRILAAAMACFGRDGFHGASMQKICAEAGMSPGALYRYFPSKEAIIAAIVESERSGRRAMLDAVFGAPSVLGALTACFQEMLGDEGLATGCLGPEIMAEAIRNADLRAAVEPQEDETRAQLREALAASVRQGEIDGALDLDMVLILLQVIGDGVILHHRLHPEWRLADRLPELEALVRRMLAPRPEPRVVPE